jgi:hypothetical protein
VSPTVGKPQDEVMRRLQPLWPPRRLAGHHHQCWKLEYPLDEVTGDGGLCGFPGGRQGAHQVVEAGAPPG